MTSNIRRCRECGKTLHLNTNELGQAIWVHSNGRERCLLKDLRTEDYQRIVANNIARYSESW